LFLQSSAKTLKVCEIQQNISITPDKELNISIKWKTFVCHQMRELQTFKNG